MRQTRTIVAVTLLATALCADRAAAAAPAQRLDTTQSSGTFAQRLTVSLRRVVPAVRFLPDRRQGVASPALARSVAVDQASLPLAQGTPFEFRLPPPLI